MPIRHTRDEEDELNMDDAIINVDANTRQRDVVEEAAVLLSRSIALMVEGEVERLLAQAHIARPGYRHDCRQGMRPTCGTQGRRWLTIAEAAEVARLDVPAIIEAIEAEQLMCYRLGESEPLINVQDLDFWIVSSWDCGPEALEPFSLN